MPPMSGFVNPYLPYSPALQMATANNNIPAYNSEEINAYGPSAMDISQMLYMPTCMSSPATDYFYPTTTGCHPMEVSELKEGLCSPPPGVQLASPTSSSSSSSSYSMMMAAAHAAQPQAATFAAQPMTYYPAPAVQDVRVRHEQEAVGPQHLYIASTTTAVSTTKWTIPTPT